MIEVASPLRTAGEHHLGETEKDYGYAAADGQSRGSTLLGVGCLVVLFGAYLYDEQRQSLTWPSTTGTVLSASVERVRSDGHQDTLTVFLQSH